MGALVEKYFSIFTFWNLRNYKGPYSDHKEEGCREGLEGLGGGQKNPAQRQIKSAVALLLRLYGGRMSHSEK